MMVATWVVLRAVSRTVVKGWYLSYGFVASAVKRCCSVTVSAVLERAGCWVDDRAYV